jgi:hypothetical protein
MVWGELLFERERIRPTVVGKKIFARTIGKYFFANYF